MHLWKRLEELALEKPQAPFITWRETTKSFGEMFDSVQRVASFLMEEGVQEGDRLGICLHNGLPFLLTYLASSYVGAIPVPLDPMSRPEFLKFCLENSEASLAIVEESHLSLGGRVLAFPKYEIYGPSLPLRPSDIAYFLYTSGTTGNPKACLITQDNLAFSMSSIIDWAGLIPGDRELIGLRLSHSFGLGQFHCHLRLGNHIFLEDSLKDLGQVLERISSRGLTGFCATPAVLSVLSGFHTKEFKLKAKPLRYIIVNTCPIPSDTVHAVQACLPETQLYMYYGLTEASRSTVIRFDQWPEHTHTVGRAVKKVEVKTDSPGGLGEVLIRGPNVMKGYWRRPPSEGFTDDGWFRSGDLGILDEQGCLEIKGRIKEQINVDGLKCLPSEVESILEEHPGVNECAVLGIPDRLTHQKVVAAVVASPEADIKSLPRELKKLCRKNLELHQVPKKILLVEELPKTDSGKVKRLAMEELFQGETS